MGLGVRKQKIIACSLAIAPILDPYIITEIGGGMTIRVMDAIVIVCALLMFMEQPQPSRYTGYLLEWCALFTIISLIGLCSWYQELSIGLSMKNLLIWMIYAVLLSYVWKSECRELFIKYAVGICLFSCLIIFLQFLLGNLEIPFWDGRIPGFSLSKYDSWSGFIDPNTAEVRPCGIFQESSYFAIYGLPVFCEMLRKGKNKTAIVIAFSLLLTTSFLAVGGVIIVVALVLLFNKQGNMSRKTYLRIVTLILAGVIALILLCYFNDSVKESLTYVIGRFTNLSSDLAGQRQSSSKVRLLGNINYFGDYPLFSKMFGVGAGQYSYIWNIEDYSSVIVTNLLNFGIVGIGLWACGIMRLYRKLESEHKIYLLIFLMVMFVDYQWFSWQFFYLLTWCVLRNESVTDRISCKMEKNLQQAG